MCVHNHLSALVEQDMSVAFQPQLNTGLLIPEADNLEAQTGATSSDSRSESDSASWLIIVIAFSRVMLQFLDLINFMLMKGRMCYSDERTVVALP